MIEVLHHGSRSKVLIDNVERYAKLGIPEYFVYDRLHQLIYGYRLVDERARRYQRIVPQVGRHPSTVLGLDLAIEGGTLRFFNGTAELPGSGDLIGRLNRMVTDLEARAEEAAAQTARAEEQAKQALSALRDGIAGLFDARGLVLSEAARAPAGLRRRSDTPALAPPRHHRWHIRKGLRRLKPRLSRRVTRTRAPRAGYPATGTSRAPAAASR